MAKKVKIKCLTKVAFGYPVDINKGSDSQRLEAAAGIAPIGHVIEVEQKVADDLIRDNAAEYVSRGAKKEAEQEKEKIRKDLAPGIPEENHLPIKG